MSGFLDHTLCSYPEKVHLDVSNFVNLWILPLGFCIVFFFCYDFEFSAKPLFLTVCKEMAIISLCHRKEMTHGLVGEL